MKVERQYSNKKKKKTIGKSAVYRKKYWRLPFKPEGILSANCLFLQLATLRTSSYRKLNRNAAVCFYQKRHEFYRRVLRQSSHFPAYSVTTREEMQENRVRELSEVCDFRYGKPCVEEDKSFPSLRCANTTHRYASQHH
ncbi:hypothetical protein EVAR_79584_1 [Eumeta japonica]|uniref:Uncharacterized protein n=1 Tax=Eumeta variegata TaxID=151549 RepID=A0A4C1UF42_EUMVA|nr:hypothetical protein EVAR_79584_1 [Eumeta japonica]